MEIAVWRTIKFAKAGGPDVLQFIEAQVPAPAPREVRIKVKAIGINRAESMWRNYKYVEPVKFPAGLGYEAAGVVDAVGKDVTDLVAGDVVSTIPAFSLNRYSTYASRTMATQMFVRPPLRNGAALAREQAITDTMLQATVYTDAFEERQKRHEKDAACHP
jgi:NADPH:quinone reductase-like Zn-dependent oxidoreductase